MSDEFRPSADALVARNADFAERRFDREVGGVPSRHLTVVTCMDCRIEVPAMLGLKPGEAHILRNAGGLVTDDVVRSIVLSQHALNTREVMVIQHTDCGLSKFDDDEMADHIADAVGDRPPWPLGAFADVDQSVRDGVERLRSSPLLVAREHIRGFVFDVADGTLREVT